MKQSQYRLICDGCHTAYEDFSSVQYGGWSSSEDFSSVVERSKTEGWIIGPPGYGSVSIVYPDYCPECVSAGKHKSEE